MGIFTASSVNPYANYTTIGNLNLKGSGTYLQNTGTIQFANSNNITFGLTNNQMTASYSQGNNTVVTTTPYIVLATDGYIIVNSAVATAAGAVSTVLRGWLE